MAGGSRRNGVQNRNLRASRVLEVNEVKLDEAEWAKLLKRWSGRPGSNRRRPAWENDCQMITKTIAFLLPCFWR